MKKTFLSIVLGLFFIPLFAQDQATGLPGDNLNLYGVLNIFQNSPTLEEFEKNLNAEDSKVNNLDLNGDGKIDYIHVIDNMNGPAHAIVLRVDVNETETQDVAVIEVEKDANNQVHVQIIGDEALYGKDYIVEPNQSTPNPGYEGTVPQETVTTTVAYPSPASWAIIGFMFAPTYVVYESPYRWGYYPYFWHPWHPMRYEAFYSYHRPYYDHFRRSYYYNAPAAHAFYGPHRMVSPIVRERYHVPEHPRPAYGRPNPSPGYNRQPRPVNNTPHPMNNQPRPVNNNNQPRPVNNNTPHPMNNQPRPVNNNTPHPVNTQPRPVNNNTPHPINNQPRPVNNNTPHPVNNQPRPVFNNTPHPTNNQPRPVNNTPHPVNTQPRPVNNTPHPINHPAPQINKNNSGKKADPRR